MNITYPTTKDHGLKSCINNRAGQVISRHCNKRLCDQEKRDNKTAMQKRKHVGQTREDDRWKGKVSWWAVGKRERERACVRVGEGGEGFGRQA